MLGIREGIVRSMIILLVSGQHDNPLDDLGAKRARVFFNIYCVPMEVQPTFKSV